MTTIKFKVSKVATKCDIGISKASGKEQAERATSPSASDIPLNDGAIQYIEELDARNGDIWMVHEPRNSKGLLSIPGDSTIGHRIIVRIIYDGRRIEGELLAVFFSAATAIPRDYLPDCQVCASSFPNFRRDAAGLAGWFLAREISYSWVSYMPEIYSLKSGELVEGMGFVV
ncbi:hypothetical protein C8R44DRAFT_740013 [Mycena epipterygia]|nr:hypothetical protein C8R44DRAFT_740013 [Mycena epipterygia]